LDVVLVPPGGVGTPLDITQMCAVVGGPFSVVPGAHHDMAVGGGALGFERLVDIPGAETVFGIIEPAYDKHGRLDIIEGYTGISGLPPGIAVGMLVEFFPEGDGVAGKLEDILQGARLQIL